MRLFLLIIFCLLSLPGFGQEDDDKLIDKIEEERRSQGQAAAKLNDIPVNLTSFFDEKGIEDIKKTLSNDPLKNFSSDQIRKFILDKYRGKFVGNILEKNPKILNTFIDILKDKKALPSLVNIFSKQEELKVYFFIWIGILIGTWIFKKYYLKKKSFLKSLTISLFTTLLSLSIFYYMFQVEVTPALEIIVKNINK